MVLLERDTELHVLRTAVAEAGAGHGSVLLVGGEAGIGKTTLVRTWLDELHDVQVHTGVCDDLLTPRVLGPLHDVARTTLPTLVEELARAEAVPVAEALLTALDHPLRPTVLVVEDVHWADEATLDVLRYVGRRVADRRGVLVLTVRDDEVDASHPLTPVLAALAGPALRRVTLAPLSARAVGELAATTDLDPDRLVAATGGNPFFVSEVVRAGGAAPLPHSVSDAVLARVRDLPRATRLALDVLSVIPGAVPWDRAEAVLGDLAVLAEAERRGILVGGDTLAFRHELGRRAIEGALTATQRVLAHRRVLAALLDDEGSEDQDTGALVHHALGAGDEEAVVRYGSRAADEAYRADAHRQAVAHGEEVLRRAALLVPEEHARLLEQQAWALYNVHRFAEARDRAAEAVTLRRDGDDPEALARALLTWSRMSWMSREREDALAGMQEAADVGAGRGDEVEAEVALHRASLLTLTTRYELAGPAVEEALRRARMASRPDLEALALNYRGVVRAIDTDPDWADDLVASIDLARRTGMLEARARGYTNIIEHQVLVGAWNEADRWIAEALPFLEDHDFAAHRFNITAQQTMLLVRRGHWAQAESQIRALQATVEDGGILDALALNVLAHLLVKQGRPDAGPVLEQAWGRAVHASSSHYIGPIASLPIEHAWLSGRAEDVPRWVEATRQVALEPWCRAEVARHAAFAGHPVELDGDVEEPSRSGLAGDWERAAGLWGERGDPYLMALELMDSGDVEAILQAVERLDALGALPAARIGRQRLRDLGVRRIPRGPQERTRANPAGLTARQMDVLALLSDGLTNAQIAEALVLSVRTVDHHVAAILGKLGVGSRHDAARRAMELIEAERPDGAVVP